MVEHLAVLVAVRHRRAQGGAHLLAPAEVDRGQRLLGGQRLGRPDRQTGAAQQVGELHDIGGELA